MAKRQTVTPSDILNKYELDEVGKAILKYKLQHPAMEQGDIANLIGVHRTVVARRMESEPWKKAFNDYFMPAKELIEGSARELARRYLGFTRSKNEAVAERATRACLTSLGILKEAAGHIENFEPLIIAFENETAELRTVMEVPKLTQGIPNNETEVVPSKNGA